MTEEKVRQIIREELEHFVKGDKYVFNRLVKINDGVNIQTGRTTGTKIGTAPDQKLGFFGKTPIVSPGAITAPSGGTTVDSEARTVINNIRTALKNLGLTQ